MENVTLMASICLSDAFQTWFWHFRQCFLQFHSNMTAHLQKDAATFKPFSRVLNLSWPLHKSNSRVLIQTQDQHIQFTFIFQQRNNYRCFGRGIFGVKENTSWNDYLINQLSATINCLSLFSNCFQDPTTQKYSAGQFGYKCILPHFKRNIHIKIDDV